ncbi:MAG: hypothetical protein Q9167_007685 [Letrouitia subvulpina]
MIVRADFDENVISRGQAERVVHQLQTILVHFSEETFDLRAPMAHVLPISTIHRQQIWDSNAGVPQEYRALVHDVIAQQAMHHPEKNAIHAWDGDFTSTKLETQSMQAGVKPGVVVPLLFEKSKWTVVTILAVIKVGGAFTLLDPSYPKERLLSITRQINKMLIVTSPACLALATELCQQTIVVGPDATYPNPRPLKPSNSRPEDRLYIIFTSGSTGTPKGAITTHANFCSAVKHQQEALQFSENTRVLDFASYGFDVAISNMLHSLAVGGCVCIPSEADRKDDLAEVITRMRVINMDVIPSVARTIDPSTVPTLRTLSLGGETATREDITRWASSHIQIVQGLGAGANTWIVKPDDHNQLSAIGSIGELLVEGPIVGEGYHLDYEKTCAAFIHNPPWLTHGCPEAAISGRTGRLYKTGDLVRYADVGSLFFIGRKDAQTKVWGQRIELEEVEHHVRRLLEVSAGCDIAAQIFKPLDMSNSILAVFVCPQGFNLGQVENNKECRVVSLDLLPDAIDKLNERLSEFVPPTMIPFTYIPINYIPFTPNGKIGRRRLKALGSALSLGQLTRQTEHSRKVQQDLPTIMERHLQDLWSQILGCKAEDIGVKDDFMQLGCDSILAMRLVSLAREQGLLFSTEDVFLHSRLCELAQIARTVSNGVGSQRSRIEPFSLLPMMGDHSFISRHVLRQLDSPLEGVEDAFAVSDFQERCIRAALIRAPRHWNYLFLDLGDGIDAKQLDFACRSLPEFLPILRTVFIAHGESFLQVIIKSVDMEVQTFEIGAEDLSSAAERLCREDRQDGRMVLGRPFTRFFRLESREQHKARLIIRLSHAQYDGISLDPMMRTMAALYGGKHVPCSLPLTPLIRHNLCQRDAGLRYWRRALKNSSMTSIPNELIPDGVAKAPYELTAMLRWSHNLPHGVTVASLMTACWAAALASCTKQSDVAFGRLVSGRACDTTQDLKKVVGPCVNMIPVRAQWPNHLSPRFDVTHVLTSIQRQHIEAIPFETVGLPEIVRHCTKWSVGTDFGSVFQYQNFGEMPSVRLNGQMSSLDYISLEFAPEQLLTSVEPSGEELKVQLYGTEDLLREELARELLDLFCTIVAEV